MRIRLFAELAMHVALETSLQFFILGRIVRHTSTDGARHLDSVVL